MYFDPPKRKHHMPELRDDHSFEFVWHKVSYDHDVRGFLKDD